MLKITRNGQITIPKEVRDQFNLQAGDYLETALTADGILLRPVKILPQKMSMAAIVARAKMELAEGQVTNVADDAELKKLIDAL